MAVARVGVVATCRDPPDAMVARVGVHERAVGQHRDAARLPREPRGDVGHRPAPGGVDLRRRRRRRRLQRLRDRQPQRCLEQVRHHALDPLVAHARTHVGEQRVVDAPGEVDGARAEDQRPAGRAVADRRGVSRPAVHVHDRGSRRAGRLSRRVALDLDVVLVADEPGESGARLQPGAFVDGARGIVDHPGVAEQHLLLVGGPHQLLLAAADVGAAVEAGLVRRLVERILLRIGLVAGHGAGVAVRPRLGEAHLPVRRVRAEEEDVRAGVAGALDGVALLAVPVFVVAHREERAAAAERVDPSADHVEVGGVAHVVAVALEEGGHVRLVAQHVSRSVVAEVRPVEADRDGLVARDGDRAAHVERLALPGVVRLVGGDAGLQVQIAHAIVLHHQRDVGAPAVAANDAHQEEAGDGVRRDRHREGRRPRAAHESRLRVDRAGRLGRDAGGALGQLARAVSAIPAEPIERPASGIRAGLLAGIGVDAGHDLDRVAGGRRDAICIGLHVRESPAVARRAVAAGHAPALVTRERVFGRDRIHVSGWPPGRIHLAGRKLTPRIGVAGTDASRFGATDRHAQRRRQQCCPHGGKVCARSPACNSTRRGTHCPPPDGRGRSFPRSQPFRARCAFGGRPTAGRGWAIRRPAHASAGARPGSRPSDGPPPRASGSRRGCPNSRGSGPA